MLRARAEELARPVLAGAATEGQPRVVVTRCGESRYALACEAVAGVAGGLRLTPVPGLGSPYRGVTVWQGQLLPVADLALFLGLPERPPAAALILRSGTALLVDEVEDVVPQGTLIPLSEPHRWLLGVLAAGALLIDAAALEADPRWEVAGAAG